MRARAFETIVVGAGSAGSVVASRGTESPDRDVLLLEAGPDYGPTAHLPRDLADASVNSLFMHDWGLRHRPTQRHFPARFPRGRVVGGSSAVNTCIALRGQPQDFDEWAELGLPEWSWERCLPYFKRLERDLDFDDDWHGTSGPLPIRRNRTDELVPWQLAFVEACDRLGFEACPDSNRPGSYGFGPHAMNRIDGRRVSASDVYLTAEVRARDNLMVRGDSHVRRLLFRGRRVVGVEVERLGRVETIAANRVVLAAGAIHTPGLLVRSGVGPRDQVESLGVELVHHNPAIGARLLDHPGTAVLFRPKRGVSRPGDPLIQTVLRYQSKHGGAWNDMQIQPGSAMPISRLNGFGVAIMVPLGKPRGHGQLRWDRVDARARPEIRSRYFEDPTDLAQAVEGLEIVAQLAADPALARLATPFWPSARRLTDRAALEDHARTLCDSGYHPSGTVPMGPDGADWAACDAFGRVRGVEGVVVADASLMPTITSSNTNLPTLMFGERFGELLRRGEI